MKKRRGLYLVDVCVGFVLAAVAMTVFTQGIFMLADHRTDMKLRRTALDTLGNVSEMISLSEPIPPQVEPLKKMVANTLPGGKLTIELLDDKPAPGVALVCITVSYDGGVNRPGKEYSLLRAFSEQKK